MSILDLIPYGKQNAVSRSDLVKQSRLSDREVREEISQLRRETPILSFGGGYFRPTKEEKPLVEKWIKQETARGKSIFWSMKGARDKLKQTALGRER